MKIQKTYFFNILIGIFLVFLLLGCHGRGHLIGYTLGTYVSQPEEGEEGRHSETFDCAWEDCYQDVQDVLKDMDVLIFHRDKRRKMISAMYFDKIYKNCIDTTEVGIFFKEIEQDKTQVDVACGNYDLAEFASEKIYLGLSEKLSGIEE